jgi:hypothetical protein
VNSGTSATEIAGISGGLFDAELAPADRAFMMQALGVGRVESSAVLSAYVSQDAVDASIEWAKASSGIPADSTMTSPPTSSTSREREVSCMC